MPHANTVEAWCRNLLGSSDLETKLSPGPPPQVGDPAHWEDPAEPLRWKEPSRPAPLKIMSRSSKTPGRGAMVHPGRRAELFHTLAHHELQAAELFAWAVLAFPQSPREFRAGLVRLAQEELGHLALYRRHLKTLGHAIGDWPVRDWFWSKIPGCDSPTRFVAFMGLGLEGANLEHTSRFATWFRAAGDETGARILESVEADEVGHVAFAIRWFEHFESAPLRFDTWQQALPQPLTPAVFRSNPLNEAARLRAGLSPEFLESLGKAPAAHLGKS